MNGYYELIIKALKEQGFFRIEGGKGSHEKWSNGKHIAIVPFSSKSRFTANQIMKDAWLKGSGSFNSPNPSAGSRWATVPTCTRASWTKKRSRSLSRACRRWGWPG